MKKSDYVILALVLLLFAGLVYKFFKSRNKKVNNRGDYQGSESNDEL